MKYLLRFHLDLEFADALIKRMEIDPHDPKHRDGHYKLFDTKKQLLSWYQENDKALIGCSIYKLQES